MRWTTEGCKIIWETEILLLNDAIFNQINLLAEWQMVWIEKKTFITSQACLLLYVGHTKEGTKGILAPKKVPEHLIWAAECEGEFWDIWRKSWAGGACGESERMTGKEWDGWNERGGREMESQMNKMGQK